MGSSLSVITICYNNLDELTSTCSSVDKQTQLPNEHLIIDGSANKDIINWLASSTQPAYRKWIHETDKGIADAFNKGIKNSTGDIIHLLNSGDTYTNGDSLKTVLNHFNEDSSLMWLHSMYLQQRGKIEVNSGLPFEKEQLWKGMRQVAHPTMFLRKEVYEQHGYFDDQLKIAMDYDLLVRIRNEKNIFIEKTLVRFAPGGVSDQQFYKGLKEVKNSYQKHIGPSKQQNMWQLRQKLLHIFMQTGIGKIWFSIKNRKNRIL